MNQRLQFMPKWQNFAKSGHAIHRSPTPRSTSALEPAAKGQHSLSTKSRGRDSRPTIIDASIMTSPKVTSIVTSEVIVALKVTKPITVLRVVVDTIGQSYKADYNNNLRL